MYKLNTKEKEIITILLKNEKLSSSDIHTQLIKDGEELSLVTIKRTLSDMALKKLVSVEGSGPATAYKVSTLGRIHADIDAKAFGANEPDNRYGMNTYNFELLTALDTDIFPDQEMQILKEATTEYHKRIKDVSGTIQKKELERLVIELAWKSSRIEGNTYTLLDTEKLILENKEATGHSKSEAQMILNHKDAFTYIHENRQDFRTVTKTNLETLHAILVKDLQINTGLRKNPVGIIGAKYRPPENIKQISGAVETLSATVSQITSPYAKALVALLGISYIQPFDDGNKRTSRLMANALLIAHNLAPLSYRSVNENEYREAILVFYELNSIVPFRKIFVSQYDFAARNYTVK